MLYLVVLVTLRHFVDGVIQPHDCIKLILFQNLHLHSDGSGFLHTWSSVNHCTDKYNHFDNNMVDAEIESAMKNIARELACKW